MSSPRRENDRQHARSLVRTGSRALNSWLGIKREPRPRPVWPNLRILLVLKEPHTHEYYRSSYS